MAQRPPVAAVGIFKIIEYPHFVSSLEPVVGAYVKAKAVPVPRGFHELVEDIGRVTGDVVAHVHGLGS